jgi:hypothetical protein
MTIPQIITIRLYSAKTYATKPVNLEDQPATTWTCDNKDIAFFTHSDLVAYAVYGVRLQMCMQGEIIESAVSQSVTFVPRILNPGKKSYFGKTGYAF